jgi:bifunctional UDP-N-acetylglucosamine pyrophosphorylase/glucosamine-1-phosphate N-acetyltransferase
LPASVDRVIVVVHYLADQIEAYLRHQTHIPQYEIVYQHTPRGTGDAVHGCKNHLRGGSFLVLNGDDLYGARDLAQLAQHPAGLLVKSVNDPERWGIATLKADGTLEKLVEKPKGLTPPQLANAGAYVFPAHVFETELSLSPRNEYEITQYVSVLAEKGVVQPVMCETWLPIGDEATWNAAQQVELETIMAGRGLCITQ